MYLFAYRNDATVEGTAEKKDEQVEEIENFQVETSESVLKSAVEEAVEEVFEDIKQKGETVKELSNQLKDVKPRGSLPNMFGKLPEENIFICLDTSGSMYKSLDPVKEHLIEALQEKTKEGGKFNLIEFNSEVTQWSDRMMECNEETVAVASTWINNLDAKTGTNTLKALITALADPECDQIYLITDGYPDQQPTEILDNVAYLSNNRPIHCHYIQSDPPDISAVEFLKDLAMESYGSFYITSISQHGVIEQVTPVYRAEAAAERIVRTTSGNLYPSNHKECSLGTTLDGPIDDLIYHTNVFPYPYSGYGYPFFHNYYVHPAQGWSRYRTSRSWMKTGDEVQEISGSLPFAAPGPGALLIGTKVLARRHQNGLYYLGTVKSQVRENSSWIKICLQSNKIYDGQVLHHFFIIKILTDT